MSVLARGGMGVVWRARHHELGSDVAVKVLGETVARDATIRRRFRTEAKTLAALRSAHIVRVFDCGLDGDAPYLVMELLEGEDLATRLEERGALSLGETSRIVTQIGDALATAHEAGLVHRDVKPSNLFLAREGGREVAKLIDFGIAKDTRGEFNTEQTASGAVLGSPRYMSPEQVRGGRVDRRSDLWALGALTFEMLTGVPLFEGLSLGDVFAKIVSDPLPTVAEHAPELPPRLDDVLRMVLERDPEERCADPRAFARALAEIADTAPDARATGHAPVARPRLRGRVGSTIDAVARETQDAPASSPPPDDVTDTLGAFDTTADRDPRAHGWRPALAIAAVLLIVGAALMPALQRDPPAADAAAAPPPIALPAAPSPEAAPIESSPVVTAAAPAPSSAPVAETKAPVARPSIHSAPPAVAAPPAPEPDLGEADPIFGVRTKPKPSAP